MPELPEVETVVRDLRPLLAGQRIVRVQTSDQKLRHPWNPDWSKTLVGATVTGLRRRGKWILVDLDTPNLAGGPTGDHAALLVHLGMTGQFTVVSSHEPEPDHVHLAWELDSTSRLQFRDPRRFGSVVYNPSAADVMDGLNTVLGREPFDLDPTDEDVRHRFASTRQNLKAILLNQGFVAGVGNIYADESCFQARLHPCRTGQSLTPTEVVRLCAAIRDVITRAIERRGSTIQNYIGGSGLRGGFQTELAVYGRAGQPCGECQTLIEVMRLAGRSTHYCPRCQRRPRPRSLRAT